MASGGLALPEFQREFVWDPNQVVELLDSVARGWPIGSLLILEGPQPFGIKSIAGGPPVSPGAVRYYLLDGQQRITSLYHALTDTGDYVYYIDLQDEGHEEEVPPVRWVSRARGIPSGRMAYAITIAELSDARYFEEFTMTLPPAYAARAREVRKRKLGAMIDGEYEIPATLMLRNIELEALTRIFETLNRTGVRLDAFDLMVAVLYPEGFHLRNEWEQAIYDYPVLEMLGASGLEVLKLIALWRRDMDRSNPNIRPSRRVTGVRQGDVLKVPPEFVREAWPRAVSAYSEALDFLWQEGGVRSADGVPSAAMTLTLAYLIDREHHNLTVQQWYWRAIADQRYLQGANTQVLADVAPRHPRDDERNRALEQMSMALLEPVRRNRILRMGVRGLLIRHGALDPLTGRPIGGPAVDVSLPDLLEGRVVMPVDRTAVEMLVASKRSVSDLKLRLKRESIESLLDPSALASQMLPSLKELDDEHWRQRRGRRLLSWMEDLL
ncbi:DUF262 domain-containing protein [Ornithinimicrobium cerasi]|uniref:DUF262 domain-containing protein n=1 Tax=Ornithinimicrobium cerasi TaxID=2248773 RepID=UPI00137B0892|nr:DUF262 domain-containing protein [Ornithinimicrobium cerasi]